MIDYQYIRHYDYSGMRTAPLCIDGHTKGTHELHMHTTGTLAKISTTGFRLIRND